VILVIILAVVAVAVVVSLFVRRHGEADVPQAGWTPTNEVFKDPGTNRTMRVWVDMTGERHYVAERPG
jgi:preprotein translocase subunit SecG